MFSQFVVLNNLVEAFVGASNKKRFKRPTIRFEKNLALNLLRLQKNLQSENYHHGKYKTFKVFEPKERTISAAPFCDRIVHHAIYQILEPIFNCKFIFDSFANRNDKGTHRAIARLQDFLRKTPANAYCLKCDVSKCFPSLNHGILKKLLAKKIGDKKLMQVVELIINSFQSDDEFNHLFDVDSHFIKDRPRGIPIGNLTSQLFVNVYLNELDQYAKHHLKIRFYIRYVDDFVILHPDKKYLGEAKKKIEFFLREELFLELHPKKQRIFPLRQGIDFLGFVIFKDRCRLRKSNRQLFKKKLKKMRKAFLQNELTEKEVLMSITSWLAHCEHSESAYLRKGIFHELLTAGNQEGIKKFIQSWKMAGKERKSSVQLPLFDFLGKAKPDEK